MKRKDLEPELSYPARLTFKIEEEIKSFPEKKKLKEFVNTKPALQELLQGLLWRGAGGGEERNLVIKNNMEINMNQTIITLNINGSNQKTQGT